MHNIMLYQGATTPHQYSSTDPGIMCVYINMFITQQESEQVRQARPVSILVCRWCVHMFE